MIDWDDAYENSAYIPGAGHYPDQWKDLAKAYRKSANFLERDISYGSHPREKYDLFQPDTPSKGVLVFVHGGYWMKLDKSFWSHLSEGARARGWTVAIPSYVLAPEARIAEITRQIATAITQISNSHKGPIRLAGHSAGGHLVSRMLCADGPLSANVYGQIEHVVSISGLHDLRPLLKTKMNQVLGLTKTEAEAESACLFGPVDNARLTTWVGSKERPEFIRQSQLQVKAWGDTKANCIIDPDHHHFSVIGDLAKPSSPIVNCLLG
ncbi:MAG: alpha/beta hydrolase [Paracoccaceae bacterium]